MAKIVGVQTASEDTTGLKAVIRGLGKSDIYKNDIQKFLYKQFPLNVTKRTSCPVIE